MDWTLFTLVTATWVFWGAHFVFKTRVKQMTEALGQEPNPMISVITIIAGLAILNFVAFFIIYGLKVSWLLALALVVGGYLASILYIAIARGGGVYDSLLNVMVMVGFVAIPGLSVLIWFRAF